MMNYKNEDSQIDIIIKESEVDRFMFPACVCPYRNRNQYMMVEINTGTNGGISKSISSNYDSYNDLIKKFNRNDTCYPILENYLIYNDLNE